MQILAGVERYLEFLRLKEQGCHGVDDRFRGPVTRASE